MTFWTKKEHLPCHNKSTKSLKFQPISWYIFTYNTVLLEYLKSPPQNLQSASKLCWAGIRILLCFMYIIIHWVIVIWIYAFRSIKALETLIWGRKKQVKKKIFDNFLNFAWKYSLRVTIWDNLPRWIVYVALKLPKCISLTALLLNLTAKTILQNLCKDIDYFLHLKKIETNLQKGSKVRDQNAYLLSI